MNFFYTIGVIHKIALFIHGNGNGAGNVWTKVFIGNQLNISFDEDFFFEIKKFIEIKFHYLNQISFDI